MFKNYLMIGLVGTMLSSTQTFAMQNDYPTFIDGQDVKIPARYLRKMLSSDFKEIQPGVRRLEVVRKTLGKEKNVTRFSRVDLTSPLDNTFLNGLNNNTILTFQWNSKGDWVYPPNTNPTAAEVKNIFTISPVTKQPQYSEI